MNKKTNKSNDNCIYHCDICGQPAVYNLQGGGWTLWRITKEGGFKEDDSWGLGDDENSFYCEKCAEEEEVV